MLWPLAVRMIVGRLAGWLPAIALLLASLLTVVSGAAAGTEVEPKVRDGELEVELQSYLSDLKGSYGVAVVNLEDGRYAFVAADMLFPAASMYKLLVMYRVFQAIDSGCLSRDDLVTIGPDDLGGGDEVVLTTGDTVSVAYALNAMITASSNAAAWALTRVAGGWGVVASAASELGMQRTVLDEDFWSTPADMARFFRLLAVRSLVSPEASDEMMELLLAQTIDDRLPALLPAEVQVAHKTGELPGVRNDGGIVRSPRTRYVIVVMSCAGDPEEETVAEARISQMVYDHFDE